jgi:hypothetical protein
LLGKSFLAQTFGFAAQRQWLQVHYVKQLKECLNMLPTKHLDSIQWCRLEVTDYSMIPSLCWPSMICCLSSLRSSFSSSMLSKQLQCQATFPIVVYFGQLWTCTPLQVYILPLQLFDINCPIAPLAFLTPLPLSFHLFVFPSHLIIFFHILLQLVITTIPCLPPFTSIPIAFDPSLNWKNFLL